MGEVREHQRGCFWLNGRAGEGKSTIHHDRHFHMAHSLGILVQRAEVSACILGAAKRNGPHLTELRGKRLSLSRREASKAFTVKPHCDKNELAMKEKAWSWDVLDR